MTRIIILVIALASGGMAAWVALPGENAPAQEIAEVAPIQEVELEEVLVTVGDLQRGTALQPSNMRWQTWPEEAVTGSLVTRSQRPNALDELQGFIASSSFVSGEPVREEKLAPAGSGYLSTFLGSGKRAIAVRITAENTAGGFILPDDRVDVVHTTVGESTDEMGIRSVSSTILTNIRILAVDQLANHDEAGASVVGRTATLEVEPRQVEILTAAESSGTLSLSLRSAADNDETPTAVANDGTTSTVRIIRSGQVHSMQVRRTAPIEATQ